MSPCPTKSSRCPRCDFRFRGQPDYCGTRTHPLWADIRTSLQQICSSHVIFCCFNTKYFFQISLVTIFSFNQHSELESLQRIGYFVLPTLLHNHCCFSLRWKILFYPENLSPQSLTARKFASSTPLSQLQLLRFELRHVSCGQHFGLHCHSAQILSSTHWSCLTMLWDVALSLLFKN